MSMKRKIMAILATAALAAGVAFMAGCAKQEQASSSSSETLEVSDSAATTSTDPFWVLIVGNDSRTGTVEIDKSEYADGTGRSDVIILVRCDPSTKKVAILSVPRDTACTYNGQTVKINETYHQGGISALKTAVKELTGVDCKYYFDMGFVDYSSFIDEIGGVTANVPIDMKLQDIVGGDTIKLSAGDQELNGAEALVLARSRKQYTTDQDACRQIQNRAVVQTLIQRVANDSANKDLYIAALYAFSDTDCPIDELSKLVDEFCKSASSISFVNGSGPYDGGTDETVNLWLTTRDEATWKKVIQAAENGEDVTSIVTLPASYK
jgi:polyisoprenyl-teichoic acid--peptidoglycan teichoic acid transferase